MPINLYEEFPLTWQPNRDLLKKTIYKSLIKILQADILSNNIEQNTKLPSQRDLADFLDINFTTVGHAYKYGIKKGILYSKVGDGTYISPNAYKIPLLSMYDLKKDIVDFGLVDSFGECDTLLMPAIRKLCDHTKLETLLKYRNLEVHDKHLNIAVDWLKTQGVITTSINQVAIINGVQNGLVAVLSTLFKAGDRIVTDRYTYANFLEIARLLQIEVIPIEYDEQGMIPEALEIECIKKKIKGIFLMPSCNNPIGFQITENRRKQLANVIEKENLYVIEDDIFSFMVTYQQGKALPTFQSLLPNHTIYLTSTTKFISSGIRVGFMVFPENLKFKIERALLGTGARASRVETELVCQILSSPVANQIIEKKYQLLKNANEIFDNVFSSMEFKKPESFFPFFRTIPIKGFYKDNQNIIESYTLSLGFRIYHSERFSPQSQSDPFIRISLTSNDLPTLSKGLKRIETERNRINKILKESGKEALQSGIKEI
ncbi:PLP-dependent aminotransferase family protein [Lactococcus taiwanensis]|uniref:PLP-dependent aminotransferase family protein n=1 Tax=Lactococcus taiwanensis TaxID=1151742 RepID=A0AA45KGQ1_9LACT|nr:PLP-dependent aminotransferase family protein [Lactococcus taiwanensis]QSE76711.1 PLP-dependent aminotransferase family protein [Lactococcus taiwanensis]